MAHKPWDPEDIYSAGALKEYAHWILSVHYRQCTLGSYVILSKREGVERITQLTSDELLELQNVMKEIESALEQIDCFKPDRFNYEQLGNELHHLHFHGFPRYKESRMFDGEKWIDETWGSTPKWKKEDLPDDFIIKIRDVIEPHLP